MIWEMDFVPSPDDFEFVVFEWGVVEAVSDDIFTSYTYSKYTNPNPNPSPLYMRLALFYSYNS